MATPQCRSVTTTITTPTISTEPSMTRVCAALRLPASATRDPSTAPCVATTNATRWTAARYCFCQREAGDHRRQAVVALDNPRASPCAHFHGDQPERQGIPRSIITRDIRRFTKDVHAAVPNIVDLLTPDIQQAIRSAIGSNFSNRLYHSHTQLSRRTRGEREV